MSYCTENSQWCIYNTQSKSERLFNAQSRVLKADWFILEINERAFNFNKDNSSVCACWIVHQIELIQDLFDTRWSFRVIAYYFTEKLWWWLFWLFFDRKTCNPSHCYDYESTCRETFVVGSRQGWKWHFVLFCLDHIHHELMILTWGMANRTKISHSQHCDYMYNKVYQW